MIVNQAINKYEIGENSAEFILKRGKMQDHYKEEINKSFKDVRSEIPLFENEVRDLDMVDRVTETLVAGI